MFQGSLTLYYYILVQQKDDKVQSSNNVVCDFHLYSWSIYFCILRTIFLKFSSFMTCDRFFQCLREVQWIKISFASLINKSLFSCHPGETTNKIRLHGLMYHSKVENHPVPETLVFHKNWFHYSPINLVFVIAWRYHLIFQKMWAIIIFTYA